jgi:nucleotide-binding universal stress UspA family protein
MSFVASGVDLRLKSVLLATDFSETSQKPLRHALAIARHYGAKFYLAHVVSSVGYTIAGPEALELASASALREAQQLEHNLVENGSLAGIDHEFIVRQGIVWEELQQVIAEKTIDLVVLGTHGRHGFGKLLLGSVAEQIFRHADCLVLTVGPWSYQEARVERDRAGRSFLFATDFGEASLHALQYAISSSNHFGAKLILLHFIRFIPIPEGPGRYTPDDVVRFRENARRAGLQRLEELTRHTSLEVKPEFLVEDGMASTASERILEVAVKLRVDAIIMGLRRSTHVGTASHLPWATAYEVVCGAGCPVLTVKA